MVKPYEPLYTIPEVAAIMKTNTNFVYGEINKGRLPYILLGSKRVKGEDLEEYIRKYPLEKPNGGDTNDTESGPVPS